MDLVRMDFPGRLPGPQQSEHRSETGQPPGPLLGLSGSTGSVAGGRKGSGRSCEHCRARLAPTSIAMHQTEARPTRDTPKKIGNLAFG
jgi:hypothetical protein